MRTFSQRMGLKPVRDILQIDSMDEGLKNKLWNVITTSYWPDSYRDYLSWSAETQIYVSVLWHKLFKRTFEGLINREWRTVLSEIRQYYFSCSWNEVYDFIEFLPNNYGDNLEDYPNPGFMEACNTELEHEMSAYRFVDGLITPITSDIEIKSIEDALAESPNPVKTHLRRSLELMSDRQSPDFRNSIKESVSAVEALCKKITGNNKATLGETLKEIEKSGIVEIHPAINKSFQQLYGYSSDAEGIRHALLEQSSLAFEDALYMLISASAFTNYLIAKATKAEVKL